MTLELQTEPDTELLCEVQEVMTCPECGSTNIQKGGGCPLCLDCFWSKCG